MSKEPKIEDLQKALLREKLARLQAESIMEAKSLELYNSNQKLLKLNESLELEVEKRTSEIKNKELQFKKIIEATTDIIYKINLNGLFTYINPVTAVISEYDEEELIGMNFLKLVRKDYKKQLIIHYLNQIQNLIETTVVEFPSISKSGKEIWINQKVTLILENNTPIELIAVARDVTSVKLAHEALRKSEEKYRGIMENLELGILEVDNDDKIVKAYPQFCRLSGYTEKELFGKSPNELLLDENEKKVMLSQNKLRLEGKSSVYEIPLIKKNGEKIWVLISGAPFYNSYGELLGTIGIHLDITKRKKIEDELINSKEIAEQSNKAKEQFLANMSHEIRTPINGIDGMCKLLTTTELNNEQKDYLNAIETSSENLLVIINDILDISKIEAGKLTIEKIGFDIRDCVSNNIKANYYKAEEKGLLLLSEIDEKIDKILIGDPTRISQIITNLVSNAIKFTTEGFVMIKLSLTEKIQNKNSIKFEVLDTGIGISASKLSSVFESFTQEDESTTRKYGGTGLGLSISKQLVELMGGELNVQSKKESGTIFSFTLELAVGTNNDLPKKTTSLQNIENLTNKDILLVEDNEINQFLGLTLLKKWKLNVDVAENGKEAIDKVKQKNYDVILMDMQMPVMGGIEATKIIREELKINTPIIALTANAIKGDEQKCIDAGMNDYISKPFEHSDLFNKVLKAINNGK